MSEMRTGWFIPDVGFVDFDEPVTFENAIAQARSINRAAIWESRRALRKKYERDIAMGDKAMRDAVERIIREARRVGGGA